MAIYSTLANKATAFRAYFNESFFNLDLNNNIGKGFSTYNAAFKWNIIKVRISSAAVIYTKV